MSRAGDDGTARRARLFAMDDEARLLVDADLAVVDDNGVLRRWLGLPPGPPESLIGALPPEDGDRLHGLLAAAQRAGPGWTAAGPLHLRSAAEGTVPLLVDTNNCLDDPELGVVVVRVRPLGDDPRVAGLGGSQQLLREVVENTPVVLMALDRDGVVRFAAGAALTTPTEQLVGRSLFDLTEDDEQVQHVQQALAGEPVSVVATWGGRHWQGRYRPLWRAGELTGVGCLFTDISAQVAAEQAHAAAEAHLRAVLDAADEAICVLDPENRVTWANAACERLFATPMVPGTPLSRLLDPESAGVVEAHMANGTTGTRDRYELRIRTPADDVVWLLVSGSPMVDAAGAFLGWVGVLTDITHHKAVERRLAVAALTDPVTGVASRVTLADRLSHALQRRTSGIVAALFLDVDGLKAVNDEHGHAAGDEVLRHVAARVAQVLRPEDTLARFGGDEFVVVCEQLSDLAEGAALAGRVRAAVATPLTVAGARVLPTVSIGVATSPPATSGEELLAAADAAAYVAKRGGRNAVHVAGDPASS